MDDELRENAIAKKIVDSAYRVHSALGPGLLESVYHKVLVFELSRRGMSVESQVRVPIVYEGNILDETFVADLIVDRCVILELKSVERVEPIQKSNC